MAGTITTGPWRAGARPSALLQRLQADLQSLDHAEALLARARSLSREDPRAAFEVVHRAALRGAGVLVERANRERSRRLPLNVWTALERIGPLGVQRAREVQVMVQERARLDRDDRALPTPALLTAHLDGTARHLEAVRRQLGAELEALALPMAG